MKVCRFFEWCDEECSERDNKLASGLLLKKFESLKKKEKILKLGLICSSVFCVLLLGLLLGIYVAK